MSKKQDKESIVAFLDKVCREAITPYLNKQYGILAEYMNCYSQMMNMKREAIADRGIFIAKKRYVLNVWNLEGVAYAEPKLKIQGLEAIRTSTPYVVREAIKDSLKIIMSKTEDDLHDYIKDFFEKFQQMPFEKVAFPRSVNEMEKWAENGQPKKGCPIGVRAAITYNATIKKLKLTNQYQEIANGSKIKFAYLKTPNPVQSNVIACPVNLPAEFKLNQYVDYQTQFEKTYVQPMNNILNTFGWTTEPKSTLEGFFS